VKGLKAEFWYHIENDIPEKPIRITKESLHRLMQRPPDQVRVDRQIYYPATTLGWPDMPPMDNFVTRWTGQFTIFKAGRYMFQIICDDGAALIIDGKPLLGSEHPYYDQHEWGAEPRRERELSKGTHDVTVEYFNSFHLSGVILEYAGPDTADSMVTMPAIIFRTPVEYLPPAVLRGAAFVRRFAGSDQAWAQGPKLGMAANLAFGLLLCAGAYGVVMLSLKYRRRRTDARYVSLQAILQ